MGFLTRRIFIIASAVLVALSLLVAAGGYAYWQSLLKQPLPIRETQIYEVRPGMGANQVLAELHRKQLLSETWPLRLWLKLNPDHPALKAGEYRLPQGIDARQLIGIFASGETVSYQVTLPEGLKFTEALALLQQQEKLTIKTAQMTPEAIMQQVSGLPEAQLPHFEGQFFPDTYRYHKGITDLQILTRAYNKMQRVLNEEWQQADKAGLPYKNAYEALIMASIVEKETGVAHERPRIAGVFVSRLEKRMRLQTDPTVIYGLGDRYQGNITRRHLREKTAYNTYRINGLPPTPIALPGREAIHAALNPKQDGSLYFVARGDGSHEFNRTLEGHNKAVRRYQIYKRKQDYQSAPSQ